jgi:hypothetical protein
MPNWQRHQGRLVRRKCPALQTISLQKTCSSRLFSQWKPNVQGGPIIQQQTLPTDSRPMANGLVPHPKRRRRGQRGGEGAGAEEAG